MKSKKGLTSKEKVKAYLEVTREIKLTFNSFDTDFSDDLLNNLADLMLALGCVIKEISKYDDFEEKEIIIEAKIIVYVGGISQKDSKDAQERKQNLIEYTETKFKSAMKIMGIQVHKIGEKLPKFDENISPDLTFMCIPILYEVNSESIKSYAKRGFLWRMEL